LLLPASALLSLNAAHLMLTKITSAARLTALPKSSTANPPRSDQTRFLDVSDVNFFLLRVVKEGGFKQDNGDHRYS
jgi:hypothetical protein